MPLLKVDVSFMVEAFGSEPAAVPGFAGDGDDAVEADEAEGEVDEDEAGSPVLCAEDGAGDEAEADFCAGAHAPSIVITHARPIAKRALPVRRAT